MTVEELLREAQYQFHNVGYGDTRENKRRRARAVSLAKKVIRKSPASSEARQANDLLIRMSGEHFASKLEQRHKHRLVEPKHSHADLRKATTNLSSQQMPSSGSLDRTGASTVTASSMLSAIMGLKSNYLMTGFGVILFLLLVFGFFLPFVAIAAFLFAGPLRGKQQPKTKRQANLAMQGAYQWMLNNQR